MMSSGEDKTLTIKKYSNRRFYDTTRSGHVTLGEMHKLICEGYDLRICDSKSGDDITNVVLTQIILEREAPKLDIFPSAILHQIIRTQQQHLGGVLEQFFAQVVRAHRSSHEQWTQFLKNTLGVGATVPGTPLEWTRSLWESFTPQPAAEPETSAANPESESPSPTDVESLQAQIAEMQRQVDRMARQQDKN